ncbi:hypothetical protein niasHT_006697 [Heterodera trifolii]|uniref:Ground-like domain-containing protein n=1 Tax=Heterodera trifolii TaxID=157864 RepID=A0ABD2LWL0_9BILA
MLWCVWQCRDSFESIPCVLTFHATSPPSASAPNQSKCSLSSRPSSFSPSDFSWHSFRVHRLFVFFLHHQLRFFSLLIVIHFAYPIIPPPMLCIFHQLFPSLIFCSTELVFLLLLSSLFPRVLGQQNAYSAGGSAPSPQSAPLYGPPARTPALPAYPPPVVQVGPQYPPPQPPLRETSYGGCAAGECAAVENAFPVPTCYLNKDGFMCCNKELENLMDNTYRNISRSRGGKWKRCNIHQVAVSTQRNAEKHFGVDFETVVGAGDFAAKNYFNQDLICKIKRENSIILAFASPA